MKELNYSLAPADWALGFQHDCPMGESCLRHAVGLLAPASLTRHATVLLGARQGGRCRLFASKEPVRMVRGMRHLLRMHGIDHEPDYDTATLEYYFP